MATQAKTDVSENALFDDIAPIEIPGEARDLITRIEKSARETLRLCEAFKTRFPEPGQQGNETTAAIKHFDLKHQEKTGKPAIISYARDGKIMKGMIARFGFFDVKNLIDAYFASTDDFIETAGYTINVFQSMAPRLIAKQSAPARLHGVTKNTQRNSEYAAEGAALIQRQYGRGRQ